MKTAPYKAPRLIQARHISYNIEAGRYIKRLEHLIYAKKNELNFSKGLTPLEAGQQFRAILSQFSDPWMLELDATNFDSNVTRELLKLEHWFYDACYRDIRLRKLLKRQLRNHCSTRQGLRYKVTATRMSGDVNTGFGNTLINYALLSHLCSYTKQKTHVLCNGDDSVLFFEGRPRLSAKFIRDFFARHNFPIKVGRPNNNPHTVEYCQNRYVLLDDGSPYMMPNLDRIQQRLGLTHKVSQIRCYERYLHDIYLCLKILFGPVSAVSNYFESLQQEQQDKLQITGDTFEKSNRSGMPTLKYHHPGLWAKMLRMQRHKPHMSALTSSILSAYPDIDVWLTRRPTRKRTAYAVAPLVAVNHYTKESA